MKKFVPLRNFIFDRLYHPTQGYFCKPNFQVGELKSPLNFKTFIGYDDYQRELAEKYPPNAWLTPCEIFKPYYGMTIANYIKSAHQLYQKNERRNKIRIVEAGAGTGSAAESILYFFSNYHRELLPYIEYNIVEISPSLLKRIEAKLSQSFPHLLKNKQINLYNQDISDFKVSEPCFLLFFEVLDNLPHDKVLWNTQSSRYDSYITVNTDEMQERAEPIEEDALVKECLSFYLKSKGRGREPQQPFLDRIANFLVQRMARRAHPESKDVFLPTSLLQLLRRIKQNIPKSHLVISDFDKLISPVSGINAPIVSKKGFKSEEKQDYSSYLVKRGEADIFFPVDFSMLQLMHDEVLGKESQVVKSFEFIQEFSSENWAQTRSNFNPIKQDFGNTSFLVTAIPSNPSK